MRRKKKESACASASSWDLDLSLLEPEFDKIFGSLWLLSENKFQDSSFYIHEQLLTKVDMAWSDALHTDIKSLTEGAASEKAMVVARLLQQGPPSLFRLIDCKSTCEQGQVILVNGQYYRDRYTAISHTWGQTVYGVFDCECACRCVGDVPARSLGKQCSGATSEHQQVVKDILQMCQRLMDTGAEYIWHDGVCIAQYDDAEVQESIRHMGWIYANATDTVIFLDYIGKPIALLGRRNVSGEEKFALQTRWSTRVWTFQEAVLSKRRRYCIRCVDIREEAVDDSRPFMDNWSRFMIKLSTAYTDDSCIRVIEEEELWEQLLSLYRGISILVKQVGVESSSSHWMYKTVWNMEIIIRSWLKLLTNEFFMFPSLSEVLGQCSSYRKSKYPADRINSVLGLAGITDFSAPKDGNLKAFTVEFLKRLDQQQLGEALFWTNHEFLPTRGADGSAMQQTWVPSLSEPFSTIAKLSRKGKRPPSRWLKGLPGSTSGVPSVVCDGYWCKIWEDHPMDEPQLRFLEEGSQVENGLYSRTNWPFSSSLLHLGGHVEAASTSCEEVIKYKVLEDGMLKLKGPMLSIPVHFHIAETSKSAHIQVPDNGSLAISLLVIHHEPMFVVRMSFPIVSPNLGTAFFPSGTIPPSASARPVVQGRVLQDGDNFRALMILAEFQAREQATCLRPLLIVTSANSDSELNPLQSPVCKLGYMLAHDNLIRVIRVMHTYGLTRVGNRVVVK